MEFETSYVIEISVFPLQQQREKDWHPPCTILVFARSFETRAAFGGELDAEKGQSDESRRPPPTGPKHPQQ